MLRKLFTRSGSVPFILVQLGFALALIGTALGLLLAGLRPAHAQGGIIYVNDDAPGPFHDGSSWAYAYTELQNALSAAGSGDEIWVAAGVYYPDEGGGQTNNDRAATFDLENDVVLYGGFAGTETLRTQRDWQAHVTVLSGDIDQNDTNTDGDFVAETWNDIAGNNSYHVVTALLVGDTAVLDGFTITAGNANGSDPHDNGGGIYTQGEYGSESTLTLTNVTFSGNRADGDGGGMCSETYSNPILTNVTFTGNWADAGGGMYNYGFSTLTDVTFDGNYADTLGGGLANYGYNLMLTDVIFSDNYGRQGGGMYNYVTTPQLINVMFSGNQGRWGGGMYNSYSNSQLINVIFSGNLADDGSAGWGGGMHNSGSSPSLTNVTFSGNRANDDGGGMFNTDDLLSSDPVLVNCTLWGNDVGGTGPQIHNVAGNVPTISYSLVQGSGGSGAGWDSGLGVDGGHNLDDDPLYVALVPASSAPTTAGNYRLQTGSPAIDAGNTLSVTVATDLDGKPRVAGATVDLGPYEAQSDLGIAKSVTPSTAVAGGTITYTLVFSNVGSVTASGVTITDVMPAGVNVQSVFSGGAVITDTGASPPHVWRVQDLAPGESGGIMITGILSPDLPAGPVTNTVVITSTTGDGDIANNRSSVQVIVQVAPVAEDATASTDEDTAVSGIVNASDANDDLLTYALTGPPSWGTADVGTTTGAWVYTPTNRTTSYADVFTVTVADSWGLTDTAQVAVYVTADDDPPTISNILNQRTDSGVPVGPIPFTVDGVDAPTETLVVTGTWSNPTLVPEGNVTFGGSGTNRTVTITPTAGLTGTTTITVTVSDGARAAYDTFVLAVGVNAPPEFTSTPIETVIISTTYTYTVTVTDADPGDTLTFTAPVSATWLTLTQTTTHTALLTGLPVNTGDYPVVLAVTDGEVTVTQNFTIAVRNEPVSIYLPLVLRN